MEDAGLPPTNAATLTYKIQYEEQLIKDTVSIVALAWLQQTLYSKATDTQPERVFSFADARVRDEFRGGQKITANFGGAFDYYFMPLGDSPYDLLLKAGIGVAF